MEKKKYGLFIPKKNVVGTSTEFVKKPSVFDEDSDSEQESNVDWVKKSLKKGPYGGGPSSRQAKSDIQKVLADDPTAYQYDEVYDELQKTINDNIAAKKSDRKPKYIQSLMATAERRKRENERRLARQIQKERETEGDEFADKEVFVTSAYKKKLEEMKKMDEEDKHMEMLEDISDVTKQSDMVGFYRHLYRVTVTKDFQEPVPSIPVKPKQEPKEDPQDTAKSSKPRQYRRRKSSESSEGEAEQSVAKESSKTENPDADSDLSLSDDEKKESEIPKDDVPDDTQNKSDSVPDNDKKDNTETTEDEKKPEESDENKENVEEAEEAKPKVSIWIKRTVGEVFDAALERYYQRKAERLAAAGS